MGEAEEMSCRCGACGGRRVRDDLEIWRSATTSKERIRERDNTEPREESPPLVLSKTR